jgi:hypothetical protein
MSQSVNDLLGEHDEMNNLIETLESFKDIAKLQDRVTALYKLRDILALERQKFGPEPKDHHEFIKYDNLFKGFNRYLNKMMDELAAIRDNAANMDENEVEAKVNDWFKKTNFLEVEGSEYASEMRGGTRVNIMPTSEFLAEVTNFKDKVSVEKSFSAEERDSLQNQIDEIESEFWDLINAGYEQEKIRELTNRLRTLAEKNGYEIEGSDIARAMFRNARLTIGGRAKNVLDSDAA